MLTSQQFHAEAAAVARSASSMRTGLPPEPVDREALLREEVQALERFAPSLGTAAALVTYGFPVVPVDRDTLTAVGREPLRDLAAVLEHWTHSRADGVAALAGAQPTGDVLVAVRTTRTAWAAWLREHAIDRLSFTDDDGREVVRENPRPLGAPVAVRWSPPPARPRTIAAAGMAAIVREFSAAALDPARAAERQPLMLAWNVATAWSVMPTVEASAVHGGVRRLPKFKSRKLASGVELLANGEPIPWHVIRPDGWTVAGDRVPLTMADGLPPWLFDAFGGRWLDEKAGGAR